MRCPICKVDLSPLDLVSRTEHVDLCIENGPATLEIDDGGGLVVKKKIPYNKQRKICPICDKTFQNIINHFKTCALKHDVPPNLMLDYWDNIGKTNEGEPKRFPCDLLDAFVEKCTSEGRLGEQVDIAKALALSMRGCDDETSNSSSHRSRTSRSTNRITNHRALISNASHHEDSNQSAVASESARSQADSSNHATDVMRHPVMRKAAEQARKKQYRLEVVDDITRASNIALRIERELAVSRSKQFDLVICRDGNIATRYSDDCLILEHPDSQPSDEPTTLATASETICDMRITKLFDMARLKACSSLSHDDLSGKLVDSCCTSHELTLLIEEFKPYTGPTIDAAPKLGSTCEPVRHLSDETDEQPQLDSG